MTGSYYKSFYSYVVPSVLAFALSGVYTIVDGFFVGQSLGDSGLTAITLGYPVSAFIQAVGTGIGLAGAIRFAILKAQGRNHEQRFCFTSAVILMLLISALLTALLLGLLHPILVILGAQGTIFELTAEYLRIIALGTVFQLLATGLAPFIRNMDGALFAMTAMIFGFVTNIILDYTFVWKFCWRMAGAAWATIIGQAITMLVAVIFFVIKKNGFHLPHFFQMTLLWKQLLRIAPAPFGLTFSPTITMVVMSRFLLLYGTAQSVAVYGCIGYVTSIVYLLLQGIGDGSQPLLRRTRCSCRKTYFSIDI